MSDLSIFKSTATTDIGWNSWGERAELSYSVGSACGWRYFFHVEKPSPENRVAHVRIRSIM